MRWMILLAMVVVGSAAVHADEKPLDEKAKAAEQERAVEDVLRGNERAWANQRARLLRCTPAELVALLGAVRKTAARDRAYDATSPLEALSASAQTQEAREAEVLRLADRVTAKDPWRALVRTWMVRLDVAAATALLGSAAKPPVEGQVVAVSAKRAKALIARLAPKTGVQREPLPALQLMAGQRGRIEHGARFAYIQDYEVEVGMGGSWITGPVVGTLAEGAHAHVTAAPTKDPATITVDINAGWSAVQRPIAPFTTQLAAAEETAKGKNVVTIQLPELRVFTVRGQVSVPRSAWIAAVAGRTGTDAEPEFRVMLLHVDAK